MKIDQIIAFEVRAFIMVGCVANVTKPFPHIQHDDQITTHQFTRISRVNQLLKSLFKKPPQKLKPIVYKPHTCLQSSFHHNQQHGTMTLLHMLPFSQVVGSPWEALPIGHQFMWYGHLKEACNKEISQNNKKKTSISTTVVVHTT